MDKLDPLELLKPDPSFQYSFLRQHWVPGGCALFGFTAVIVSNAIKRRPLFSGIQKHVLATTAGYFIGTAVANNREERLAERDAIYRHYIQLHPDDFPPVERIKIKDMFKEWIPIR